MGGGDVTCGDGLKIPPRSGLYTFDAVCRIMERKKSSRTMSGCQCHREC